MSLIRTVYSITTIVVLMASALFAWGGERGEQGKLTILRPAAADSGAFRWMDAADQEYSPAFINGYRYSEASVVVQSWVEQGLLWLRIKGRGLKPYFAYQIKLSAAPGSPSAEPLGLAGRWWRREWTGNEWSTGWNLNDKGDGTAPNPNDLLYYERHDEPDDTSPTGLNYRYEPYWVIGWFITDGQGTVDMTLCANNSYHVLWENQSTRADTARRHPRGSGD